MTSAIHSTSAKSGRRAQTLLRSWLRSTTFRSQLMRKLTRKMPSTNAALLQKWPRSAKAFTEQWPSRSELAQYEMNARQQEVRSTKTSNTFSLENHEEAPVGLSHSGGNLTKCVSSRLTRACNCIDLAKFVATHICAGLNAPLIFYRRLNRRHGGVFTSFDSELKCAIHLMA